MKGSDIKKLVITKLEEKSAFLPNSGASGPVLSGGNLIDELKPIYSYIDDNIADAANEVLSVVPISRVIPREGLSYREDKIGIVNIPIIPAWTLTQPVGQNKVKLPPDFLRLHTFRMKEWIKPVHNAIIPEDPLYPLQYGKYTKGHPYKPVVVVRESKFDSSEYDLPSNFFVHVNFDLITPAGEPYIRGVLSSISSESVIAVDRYNDWYYCYLDDTNTYYNIKLDTAYLEFYSVDSDYTIDEFLYIPEFAETEFYKSDVAEAIAINCAKKVYEIYGNTEMASIMQNELNSVLNNMRV